MDAPEEPLNTLIKTILKDFTTICQPIPVLFKIGQQQQQKQKLYVKNHTSFCVIRQRNIYFKFNASFPSLTVLETKVKWGGGGGGGTTASEILNQV